MLLVPVAHAQSTADLTAQISGLLAMIQQLQAQLNAKGGTTMPASIPSSDLTVGSKGADVSALQQILINGGYLKIAAPTGTFGPLTKAALAAWQAANNVSPAAGYYGAKTRAALAASMPTNPTNPTNPTSPTNPTAPASGLVVSLASDNPTAGSLIAGAGRTPVLAVNLTAGNSSGVTVSEIKFTKQGVLSDTAISGAYLVENGKVLSQYSSLNQGVISFSGVNLSVAAGQTRKVWLAIDPASTLAAGNTVSFAVTAGSVMAVDAANTVVTPAGNFPLNGNVFTVTTVSSPSIATFGLTAVSVGASVTAGEMARPVAQYTLVPVNSPVILKSINFRVTGSANKSDIRNVKLMLNGQQVGDTLPQVAADGSAYFNLENGSTSVKINTGSSNLQVHADIMGSPSFTFKFQLLNGFDVLALDSQYGVPVAASVTTTNETQITIAQGKITLSLASDTPTGQIAKGGSATNLAKFTLYAAGEPIRVKFLSFTLTFTGTTTTLSSMIKNIALVDDAGAQVGSTISTPTSGNTCSVGGSTVTAGYNAAGTIYTDCFGTASSPINYTVPANTTRVLTLRGDIQSGAGFTTILGGLSSHAGDSNIQGMTSSQTNSTAQVAGSALTLVSSTLTSAANSAIGTQTVSTNQANVLIGSYSLKASTAEGVNLNTIQITTSASGTLFSNLRLMVGNVQFGTTQSSVDASTPYSFSGTLNIPSGQTKIVDVYANALSSIGSGTTYPAITSLTGCTGQGAVTYTSVTGCTATGQSVLGASGATITATVDASSPQARQIVAGSTQVPLATFRFNETSNVENVKISNLVVFQQVSATSSVKSTFSDLGIYVGSETSPRGTSQNGTAAASSSNPGAGYYHQFSFADPLVVPKNGALLVTLKGNVGTFSNSGVTDNATFVFKIATSTDSVNDTTAETVDARGLTSSIAATTTLNSATANTVTVLRNKLSVSAASLNPSTSNAVHTKGSNDDLGIITFAADSTGSGGAVLNTVTVTFSGTAPSISTFLDGVTLRYGGTDVTTAGTLAGITVTSATSSACNGSNNLTCTKSWNFGTGPTSGLAISPGTSVAFTLQVDSTKTLAGTSGVSQSLSAAIASASGVQFYTAPDSTGAGPVSLQANAVPLTINSVSYNP